MQDISHDRETVGPMRRHAYPSPGRRLRAIASLILVLAVSLTHGMPVGEISAEASGPGWEASHESNRLVTGASTFGSERTENEPPRDVQRGLDQLSSARAAQLEGIVEIVIFLGALLSIRWRKGALAGGIAAVAWLSAILAFKQNLHNEVQAIDWPGSLDLEFLPALGFIIASHIALVLWFVIRWILDVREDRRIAAT